MRLHSSGNTARQTVLNIHHIKCDPLTVISKVKSVASYLGIPSCWVCSAGGERLGSQPFLPFVQPLYRLGRIVFTVFRYCSLIILLGVYYSPKQSGKGKQRYCQKRRPVVQGMEGRKCAMSLKESSSFCFSLHKTHRNILIIQDLVFMGMNHLHLPWTSTGFLGAQHK